jgi:hypothetical protein
MSKNASMMATSMISGNSESKIMGDDDESISSSEND